jgi:type VI secretion system protein ImpC
MRPALPDNQAHSTPRVTGLAATSICTTSARIEGGMSNPRSLSKADVRLTSTAAAVEATPRGDDTPMRVAILGDFSGRGDRARLAERKPIRVDRDNADEVLSRLGVTLSLPAVGTLRFAELDDFHPDRLVRSVPAFEALRELRSDLRNPSTFAKAAERMRSWSAAKAPAAPVAPPREQPGPGHESSRAEPADVLDQLLAATPAPPQRAEGLPGGQDWQSFLQRIVEPHLLPKIDFAEQAALEAVVNEAAGAQLRSLLHHPDFQAAEAAWRAVHFLTRRLETDERLQLYLVDVTKAELAADLASGDDLHATGICRLLAESAKGGRPWGILAGLYTFDDSREDVELLGRVARLARQADAPFLAEGGCRVLGCVSLAQTPDAADWAPLDAEAGQRWDALRGLPEAAHLGLALPRFLLRLPYGKDTSPVEAFDFEELPAGAGHGGYLWGNPAVACAYLLAESFRRRGWDFHAGTVREVADLPLHVCHDGGESRIKPCAEALLDEKATAAILDRGLMALVSVRDRDVVRVVRFQSLAGAATPLAGRWS